MKKSLCILLSIVSSCSGFLVVDKKASAEKPVSVEKKVTCFELLSNLENSAPKKRTLLVKPEVIAAVAAGAVTTLYGKPVVQPVVATVAPSVQTRSTSFLLEAILFGLGVCVTGIGAYSYMGHEMGVIVSFKGTIKKLAAQISEWQNIINHLQINQTEQEAKLAQAQLQIQKMLPLMQQLVKQSSNEQVLAQTVSHLYIECAGMVDRIKGLEDTLQTVIQLSAESSDAAKTARAKELKKLITKSNNIFGKPVTKIRTSWWHAGTKFSAAF